MACDGKNRNKQNYPFDWRLLSFANGIPILKNYSYKYDLLTLRKVFVKGAVSDQQSADSYCVRHSLRMPIG